MMANKTSALRTLLIAGISNLNLDNFHTINWYHIE